MGWSSSCVSPNEDAQPADAQPDASSVGDGGVSEASVLDHRRFREAARCPECDVLHAAVLNLPETRAAAASAKLRAPDGRFFEITLRDSGEVVDGAALLGDERRAVKARFGKLRPELHAWLSSAGASDRAWVWIWAEVKTEHVRREELLASESAAKAHADKVQKDLDAALAPIREWLAKNAPEAERGDGGGPMLRARLSASEVKLLAELPQVAMLGTDSYPGRPTSTPWSSTSQWAPTLRLDWAHYVSTGEGARVCVKEDARPDDTSLLVIEPPANPYGATTSAHVRGMAGIIRNIDVTSAPWRSVAPSATVYIANWADYTGTGGVNEWCRTNSAHVLSYSWEVAPGSTALTATDWAHDWLAKNSPYMVVVASAGQIGTNDYVVNRGYNGLVGGATDDRNTGDRSDDLVATTSAWRNPSTAHGDHELPHVVAPGNGAGVTGTEFGGTSAATAMVSGITALLTASDLNGWPEVKRAIVLATATGRADQGLLGTLSGAGDMKIGAGEVDAFQAAGLGTSSYVVAPNAVTANGRTAFTADFASSFGADGYLTTKWKARPGANGRLRVVVTWDATASCPSGTSAPCTGDTIDGDFDLHLFKKTDGTWTTTGSPTCSSATWDSAIEMCDLPVLANEEYLIGIRKWGTTGSSTYMGVAWFSYAQPSGSPCTSGTECSSTMCNAGRCACTADSHCPDRFCDASGQCATRQSNGLACTRAAQCASGNCVDGVCCDGTCLGACRACTAAKKGSGADGTCGYIGASLDPELECPQQTCSGGTVTRAQVCSGSGSCTSAGTYSCGGYVCAGTGCRSTCANDGDCIAGYFCSGTSCVAKKGDGVACTAANECLSGSCVDGVCCDTSCVGACRACTAAKKGTGSDGTCGYIVNGLDPEIECSSQTCTAGTVTRAWVCDGAGACRSAGTYSCDGYTCVGTACRATCATDVDCTSTHYCAGTSCAAKKTNGLACSAANECASGYCVDGVCCDSGCTGSCQACSAAKKGSGSNGTCGSIADGENPDGECPGATCAGGTITNAQVCNGGGACRANGTTPCGGYACVGAGCGTTCTTNADCASTHYCDAAACVPKKTNGAACTTTFECSSGNCVDGVCCNTACSASCQGCNVAGSLGTCTATDEAGCAPICGSGVRNEAEECDDGLGTTTSVRRGCSSTCRVEDLPVAASSAESPARTLGSGRHPIAASTSGHAVAYLEDATSTARIFLSTFDGKGTAQDPPKLVAASAPLSANPVVASLPDGKYVVAYTNIGGDGDLLGVALQKVDPSAGAIGAVTYANTTTSFSQYDADLLWTGTELVAAWVDTSSFATGADVKLRRFTSSLAPIAGEEIVANTSAVEADVALAPFGTGYAVAWRSAKDGAEQVLVRAAGKTWSAAATMPGPSGVKPALVQLDSTHLLLAFTEHGFDSVTGELTAKQVRGATVDTATTGGTVSTFALAAAPSTTPALTRVGSRVFLAWNREATPGSADGDELWLQELGWNGSAIEPATAMVLPRAVEHRVGDQRWPALAGGTSLMTAWEDYGTSFGVRWTAVATQVVPVPIFRSGAS
ncbi:MAG: hypothetical protein HYV09_09560 [Deltaproteobacteria bacterium]|nr:hypothetical protein [Deltaproteobacteria bacterium]